VKKTVFGIVIGFILGGALVGLYTRRPHEHTAPEGEKPEPPAAPSFVLRGAQGETLLKLAAEAQSRMGLKVAPLTATSVRPEVKAFGRVLDPAPLAALLVEQANAQAALEASTKEFARLKALSQTQNASLRALETAQAALQRDQVALDSMLPRLLMGWGRGIASRPDLPALARALASQELALVRADLPLSQSLLANPTGGRLAALTAPDQLAEAQFLGPAPSVDAALQSQGFLFLQRTNPLPPGAAVVAWLTLPGDAESRVTVPREALLRHEGAVFVYLQTGDDTFARRPVELDRPVEAGWLIREGLKLQDKVVIVGAQQLLSEELKGEGGEE
jgi:hypothetical protein